MPSSSPAITPLHERSRSVCFVCGPDQPHGLKLKFTSAQTGTSETEWTPTSQWQGFEGIVHGGIVSTVLDEAMSKALASTQTLPLTAELRVRFRPHVETAQTYVLRGWITERRKRMINAEAALTTPAGAECAHAWGTFAEPPSATPAPPPATPKDR